MFLAWCGRVRASRVGGVHAADACVCGSRSDECRWRQAVTAAGWAAEPSSCGSTLADLPLECMLVLLAAVWVLFQQGGRNLPAVAGLWQGQVVLFDVTRRHTPLSGDRRVSDGLGKLNSLLPPILLPGPCVHRFARAHMPVSMLTCAQQQCPCITGGKVCL